MSRGFTIIELLTVTAIIVLLTGLILPNWQAGKSQFALERSTSKLTQDIRRVQEMALAASEVNGRLPYGYGLHIDLSDPYTYFLYADFDDDNNLDWNGSLDCKDPGWTPDIDCKIETIQLERKVQVSNVGPTNTVTIAFAAPTPTVTIYPAPPANITLSTEARTKSICVNSLGLIEVAEACTSNNPPIVNSCSVSCDPAAGDGCRDDPATPDTLEVDAGVATQFTLNGTATDPEGNDTIDDWYWVWGDGSEISPPPPSCIGQGTCSINESHSYSAGSWSVSVSVRDNQGAESGPATCTPQIAAVASNITCYTGRITDCKADTVNVVASDCASAGYSDTPPYFTGFVTSQSYNGDLYAATGYNKRGAEAGDYLCNQLASAAKLPGAESYTTAVIAKSEQLYAISMAKGLDNNPVMTIYGQNSGKVLQVAKCGNDDCTSGNVVTTIDSLDLNAVGGVGLVSAIAVPSDGNPVVAYKYSTDTEKSVRVIKCGNPSCSSGNSSPVPVAYNVVSDLSIAIASSGYPVVAFAPSSGGLTVVFCGNVDCSSISSSSSLESGQYIYGLDLIIGVDGKPVVVYGTRDQATYAERLKVLQCGSSSSCSSTNGPYTIEGPQTPGENDSTIYWYPAITLGSDGKPVIAFGYNKYTYDPISGTYTVSAYLKVIKCTDAGGSCSSRSSPTTLQRSTNTFYFPRMTSRTPASPVIMYDTYQFFTGDLSIKVVKCDNDTCSSGSAPSEIAVGDLGTNPIGSYGIITGSDGNPRVGWHNQWQIYLYKCGSADCSTISSNGVVAGSHLVSNPVAVAIGSNGKPTVAYGWFDYSYTPARYGFKIVNCGSLDCLSGNNTSPLMGQDPLGMTIWPYGFSMAFRTDGNPVFAYGTNQATSQITKCGNSSCSSGNFSTNIDTRMMHTGNIKILASGNPVVVYDTDNVTGTVYLKAVLCGNSTCSSDNTVSIIDQNSKGKQYYPSMALGQDGKPVIAVWQWNTDTSKYDLKVFKCQNTSCSSGSFGSTIDSYRFASNPASLSISIAVGADGNPVISYDDGSYLKVAKCRNASCFDGASVVNTGEIGSYSSIAMGQDGYPVISYFSSISPYSIKVAKCGNADCSSDNVYSKISRNLQPYSSIAIGSDGNPVVAFYSDYDTDHYFTEQIDVVHCADPACQKSPLADSTTYTAWVSNSETTRPQDRGLSACAAAGVDSVAWYLPDGITKIADNWNALVSGTLNSGINQDEKKAVQSGSAWTCTTETGSAYGNCDTVNEDCNDWQSSGSVYTGRAGNVGETTGWSSASDLTCDTTQRLYCLQNSP